MQVTREEQIDWIEAHGVRAGTLVGADHGAVNGFCIGIACYQSEAYNPPGLHDDQEGFYVLEGSGWIRLGAPDGEHAGNTQNVQDTPGVLTNRAVEEHPLEPGMGFVVPAGVPHSLRRASGVPHLKVLWCHGAI